jgi:hypothetical protein
MAVIRIFPIMCQQFAEFVENFLTGIRSRKYRKEEEEEGEKEEEAQEA